MQSDTPLTPAAFQILLALVDGERHGYAIMREIADRTSGRFRLGPGTLYTTLPRLLEQGLIEEMEERPDPERDDTRRRYYRLTRRGHEAAAREAERLEELVRSARAKKLIALEGHGGRQ
jgi:DNA-binding PadR family transcriptional regulator